MKVTVNRGRILEGLNLLSKVVDKNNAESRIIDFAVVKNQSVVKPLIIMKAKGVRGIEVRDMMLGEIDAEIEEGIALIDGIHYENLVTKGKCDNINIFSEGDDHIGTKLGRSKIKTKLAERIGSDGQKSRTNMIVTNEHTPEETQNANKVCLELKDLKEVLKNIAGMDGDFVIKVENNENNIIAVQGISGANNSTTESTRSMIKHKGASGKDSIFYIYMGVEIIPMIESIKCDGDVTILSYENGDVVISASDSKGTSLANIIYNQNVFEKMDVDAVNAVFANPKTWRGIFNSGRVSEVVDLAEAAKAGSKSKTDAANIYEIEFDTSKKCLQVYGSGVSNEVVDNYVEYSLSEIDIKNGMMDLQENIRLKIFKKPLKQFLRRCNGGNIAIGLNIVQGGAAVTLERVGDVDKCYQHVTMFMSVR